LRKQWGTVVLFCLAFVLSACTTGHKQESAQAQQQAMDAKHMVIQSAATGAAAGAVLGGVTGGGIPVSAAAGALVGGVLGEYLAHREAEVLELQGVGVYFLHFGDKVMLVIPSQLVFKPDTASFSSDAKVTLNLVKKLLQNMVKISVKISVFTAGDNPNIQDLVLSKHQADQVLQYLFGGMNAIDVRLISAQGYGSGHPIQFTQNALKTLNLNNRIEITLTDFSDHATSAL